MMTMRKTAVALLTACLFLSIQTVMAAPAADLWPRWQAHDPDSSQQISHEPWNRFLARYVSPSDDGIHRVNYAGVTEKDKQSLAAYLEDLQAAPVSTYKRAEQFAYWVNLYNALTVKLILDHYPVDSIRDIRCGFFSFGPWNEQLVTVEGEALSLNDVEHRILRPIWKDSRIHYAVNCASIGCPNLALQAYTSANTESLLEESAKAYVNHPRGLSVSDKQLVASKIYDWFAEDFGDSKDSLVRHWLKYADPQLQEKLKTMDEGIDWDYEYDWSLNEKPES